VKEQRLRTSLALAVVCIHILVFGVLLLCRIEDWFTREDLKTGLSLAAPTFASSVALVVKYAIETKDKPPSQADKVSGLFAGLTVLFLVAVTSAIGVTIFAKAWGMLDISDFSLAFGGIESLLAVYFGQLTVALFQTAPSKVEGAAAPAPSVSQHPL
jgi:hypothetical protein